MKKKSPFKVEEIGGNVGFTTYNNSLANNNNNSLTSNNNSLTNNNNNKNEQFKNDRNNRLELLLKNHGKCSTVNQMILDLFKQQQAKYLPVSYFLFKTIEK